MSTPASAPIYGVSTYYAAHRLSAKGVVGIVVAHVGVLSVLASLDAIPLPPPLTTLMVRVIAPPPPAVAEITPPRPAPAARKPVLQPTPDQSPQTLAVQSEIPSAAAEAPVVEEAPPPAPATPATVTQARFDADYLQNPAPAYPALSRRLGEQGTVVLRVFVEPTGRPSQIGLKTGSGSPRLDQAALDAVRRWKFVAAQRGDEAVGAWVLVPIVFNLRD